MSLDPWDEILGPEQPELREQLKAEILAAYGLKPWQMGEGPVPRRLRLLRWLRRLRLRSPAR